VVSTTALFRQDPIHRASINYLRPLAASAAFCLFVLSADGCKKASDTVPVSGKITYRGQPLTSAGITFFPTKGRTVTATAAQGEYATELAPGDYVVVVAVGVEYPPGFKEGDPAPPPKVVLPAEYTVRAKSTLKATVKPGQAEPIDFDLK
jgi:hypothetical protein